MAKKREYPAWCIWSPDVGPLLATFAPLQKDAIHIFCKGDINNWRHHKRAGYRCVRVVIAEKG